MLKDTQGIQYSKLFSAILLTTSLGLAGCGGGGDGDQPFSTTTDTDNGNDDITNTDETLSLNSSASATALDQGESSTITLTVVNESSESKTFNPSSITYSSTCVTSGQSALKLDTTSTSTTQAKFTYTVDGCSSNDKVTFKLGDLETAVDFSITDSVSLSVTPAEPTALQPNSEQAFILKFVNQNDEPVQVEGIDSLKISSNCISSQLATGTKDEASASNSSVKFIYKVNGCPGDAETDDDGNVLRYIDKITFSGKLGIEQADQTVSQSINLELIPDTVRAIEAVNISHQSIAVKGTGSNETSDITFKVTGQSSGVVIGQEIKFSIQGAGVLQNESDISGNDGLVTATVASTTKTSTIQVTAYHEATGVETESPSNVVVAHINPTDTKARLLLDAHNVQAWNDSEPTVKVTAVATDRSGVAVIDGTTIQFYSDEAGQIDPYCTTENGECVVTWSPKADQPADGRVQIFAYVKGNEYFVDNNSNDIFDDGDVFDPAIHDRGEPFSDDNNNGVWDSGERFIDTQTTDASNDTDGLLSSGDFKWNGTNCQHSTLCGDVSFINIGIQTMLVVAKDTSPTLCQTMAEVTTLAPNASGNFSVYVSDGNLQAINSDAICGEGNSLPAGTTIKLEASSGKVTPSSITVEPEERFPNLVSFQYTAPEEIGSQTLSLIVTIPGKAEAPLKTWTVDVTQ